MTLSAEAMLSSAQLANIFSGWLTTLTSSITGPIFDGYKRKAEVERTRAVVDERMLNYKDTVFTAFKEVQDSLVQESGSMNISQPARISSKQQSLIFKKPVPAIYRAGGLPAGTQRLGQRARP